MHRDDPGGQRHTTAPHRHSPLPFCCRQHAQNSPWPPPEGDTPNGFWLFYEILSHNLSLGPQVPPEASGVSLTPVSPSRDSQNGDVTANTHQPFCPEDLVLKEAPGSRHAGFLPVPHTLHPAPCRLARELPGLSALLSPSPMPTEHLMAAAAGGGQS